MISTLTSRPTIVDRAARLVWQINPDDRTVLHLRRPIAPMLCV
jgi:hypothetical protein